MPGECPGEATCGRHAQYDQCNIRMFARSSSSFNAMLSFVKQQPRTPSLSAWEQSGASVIATIAQPAAASISIRRIRPGVRFQWRNAALRSACRPVACGNNACGMTRRVRRASPAPAARRQPLCCVCWGCAMMRTLQASAGTAPVCGRTLAAQILY